VAEMQGWRLTHEDSHAIRCDGTSGIFWVLDGHGGDCAANFGAPALVRELGMASGVLPTNDEIERAFERVDDLLRAHVIAKSCRTAGSTVIGALVARQPDGSFNVKLANSGDSRAVISRGPTEDTDPGGARPAVVLPSYATADDPDSDQKGALEWPMVLQTVDHKPDHPLEKLRIEAAGGRVTRQYPPRVDGILAVSRALADFDFKKSETAKPADQKVTCMPDVYEISGLKVGSLIILACDGVWDVMSSEACHLCPRSSAPRPKGRPWASCR
jgi:serine/threonine protein phosphatase PrpC